MRIERRRDQRVAAPVAAWLRFCGNEPAMVTATIDLSPSGARFAASRPMLFGAPVLTYLALPDGGQLESKGRVAWCHPRRDGLHHFGVRFCDVCEDEARRVERALRWMGYRPAV
jgi:hypothetical protein